MLYANMNINGEVSLVKEDKVTNLASYDELIDELSLTGIEIGHLTKVKNGVVVWYKKECEMSLIKT